MNTRTIQSKETDTLKSIEKHLNQALRKKVLVELNLVLRWVKKDAFERKGIITFHRQNPIPYSSSKNSKLYQNIKD